jgi:hypothetical protein
MDALCDDSSGGAISLSARHFTDPDTDVEIRYVWWMWWACGDQEQVVGSVDVNDDTKAEFRELLICLLQTACGY